MSVQEKYTEEEWFLIKTTPSLVGSAVAGAGNSGIMGTMKEAMANVRSIMEANDEYAENPLIGAIVHKPASREEAKEMASDYKERLMDRMKENNVTKADELAELSLVDVEAACMLVEEREDLEVALEYKNWVFGIGIKVAEAAKEGGFLGFGGTQVSENEQAFLERLKVALCIDEAV